MFQKCVQKTYIENDTQSVYLISQCIVIYPSIHNFLENQGTSEESTCTTQTVPPM